ncbi:MAG: hypothetical protein V4616_14525 [Bacteroidota bacterium]
MIIGLILVYPGLNYIPALLSHGEIPQEATGSLVSLLAGLVIMTVGKTIFLVAVMKAFRKGV